MDKSFLNELNEFEEWEEDRVLEGITEDHDVAQCSRKGPYENMISRSSCKLAESLFSIVEKLEDRVLKLERKSDQK